MKMYHIFMMELIVVQNSRRSQYTIVSLDLIFLFTFLFHGRALFYRKSKMGFPQVSLLKKMESVLC